MVVPNAMCAVVGQEEERRIAAHELLNAHQEGPERLVEGGEARHEVLVCRHEVEQREARGLSAGVHPPKLDAPRRDQFEPLGGQSAVPHTGAVIARVPSAWLHGLGERNRGGGQEAPACQHTAIFQKFQPTSRKRECISHCIHSSHRNTLECS